MIFHLAEQRDWRLAQPVGRYRAPSLEREGFIHASSAEQVMATAARFYAGRTDLVLLAIDPDALDVELRWEAPMVDGAVEPDREGAFPHLYGSLDLGAVRWSIPMEWRDGTFVVPQQLEQILRP